MSTSNRYDALSSYLDSPYDSPTSVSDRHNMNKHKVEKVKPILEEQEEAQDEKDFGPYLLTHLRANNWRTFTGKPIDKEVLRKYLKEVVESEGFNINHFPGYIQGFTAIRPYYGFLQNYENMMELATTAIKTYNKKHHQSKYKVVEVKKVNSRPAKWGSKSKDDNGSVQSKVASVLTCLMIVMVTLFVWFAIILPPYNLTVKNCKRLLLKLKSAPELKATEYELSELCESDCETFQTKVWEDGLRMKREILLCRPSRECSAVIEMLKALGIW